MPHFHCIDSCSLWASHRLWVYVCAFGTDCDDGNGDDGNGDNGDGDDGDGNDGDGVDGDHDGVGDGDRRTRST